MPESADRIAAESALLERGTRLYPDALAAMREYCALVQRYSREVVATALAEFLQAMGMRSPSHSVTTYQLPTLGDLPWWDGSWAWVSVRIDLRSYEPSGLFNEARFGVLWDVDVNGAVVPHIVVMVHPNIVKLRDAMLGRLKAVHEERLHMSEAYEICLRDPVRCGDVEEFKGGLERLVREWIEFFKQVGGVDGLMATTAS